MLERDHSLKVETMTTSTSSMIISPFVSGAGLVRHTARILSQPVNVPLGGLKETLVKAVWIFRIFHPGERPTRILQLERGSAAAQFRPAESILGHSR